MKWGLALSGGGVPGVAAELGFLKVLSGEGLWPDVLVGTSAGGLVAGTLGAGVPLPQLVTAWHAVAADPSWVMLSEEAWHLLNALRPSPTPGLLDLAPVLTRVAGAAVMGLGLSDWLPGYAVTASDLTADCSVVLSRESGSAAPFTSTGAALLATAAFPGVFSAQRGGDGHLYVDGGLFALDPVRAAQSMGAEAVVSVRIGAPLEVPPQLGVPELLRIVVERGLQRAEGSPLGAKLDIHIPVRGGLVNLSQWFDDYASGGAAAVSNLQAIRSAVAG